MCDYTYIHTHDTNVLMIEKYVSAWYVLTNSKRLDPAWGQIRPGALASDTFNMPTSYFIPIVVVEKQRRTMIGPW